MIRPFVYIIILLILSFAASSSMAQGDNLYLGQWEGHFIHKFVNGKVQSRKIKFEFHSLTQKTLSARVVSYSLTDTTKVLDTEDNLTGEYDRYHNDFVLWTSMGQSEIESTPGYYVFRFSDLNTNILIGTFYPHLDNSPDVKVVLNRKTSDFYKKEYQNCQCDDKVYALIRGFIYETEKDKHGGIRYGETSRGESIREMSTLHPIASPPIIHKNVLPFSSVALAKGFDNRLYSVASVASKESLKVYCYDPATKSGKYTHWLLPNPAVSSQYGRWLSGGTDNEGNIYFMTDSAEKLVKINPAKDEVTTVWETCPLGSKSDIYETPLLSQEDTYGNFCFDDKGFIYLITGFRGNIVKIDIRNGQVPKVIKVFAVAGLPETGLLSRGFSYGDILIQKDAQNINRAYVTGSYEIYEIDLEKKRVIGVVAPFHNADLAGCNIFKNKTASVTEVSKPTEPTVVPAQPVNPNSQRLARRNQLRETPTPLNVSFKQSEAEFLKPGEAYQELDNWVESIKNLPTAIIEITGHTDNKGNESDNLSLSQNRAILIKKYFMENGIAGSRIRSQGKGSKIPRASNNTDAGRKENRRVEITLISK